jgi:hypothetical protein
MLFSMGAASKPKRALPVCPQEKKPSAKWRSRKRTHLTPFFLKSNAVARTIDRTDFKNCGENGKCCGMRAERVTSRNILMTIC